MLLFALANAGVPLNEVDLNSNGTAGVALGIFVGLVVGKLLGILVFSWLAVRLGWAVLPRGVSWTGVFVVGCSAGIGFTITLFIGDLAYAD